MIWLGAGLSKPYAAHVKHGTGSTNTSARKPLLKRFSALAKDASPALLASLVHAGLYACTLPGIAPAAVAIPCAFIALLPLLWIAKSRVSLRATLLGVWLGQLPLWVLQQWWVIDVSEFGFFPFVALMASYVPVFVLLMRVARDRVPFLPMPLAAAVLWVGVEFFRARLFLGGYAWGLTGDVLIDSTALATPARVGGASLLSFLMMLLVGGTWRVIVGREHSPSRRWVGAVCAGGAVTAWVATLFIAVPRGLYLTQSFPVGVVQTNVPQSNKIGWTISDEVRDFRRFTELTRQAAGTDAQHPEPPSFIAWPETMMPGMTLEPDALASLRSVGVFFRVPAGVMAKEEVQLSATAFEDEVLAMQKSLNVPMLVGEEALEGFVIKDDPQGSLAFDQKHRFNSTYLLRDGEVQPDRYDKIHLTPFGEVMPLISRWDWLEDKLLAVAAGGMRFDLSEGTRRTVFTIPAPIFRDERVRVVTPICFESTDSFLCRRLVFDGEDRRADVIVNLTNDGWFGESDLARRQHLRAARWRAFELWTPVVRAANTGISAVIDGDGRVREQLASRVDGVLRADIGLQSGITLFAVWGEWPGWACLVGLCGVVVGFANRERQRAA